MAENVNALILPIGADASQFEKSIKEVKDALKSLQKEIAAKPFNLVTDQQIDQLRGLESTLERLQGTVKGTSNSFDQGEASTKKASRALNSLSLVAQDAPFGFIGIQNNLPGVITAFGQLDFKTNGLKGGLKELGASLVGPAGLFLAFSAVTAAVTFAIKEYGSLTNAVKVLFGANSVAIKSQNEFNKALADAAGNSGAQIAKINILVKTIQDENTSQQDRLAAYRELKKINPDVVAGIDEQNLSTSKSIKLIGENAKAQLEFIKLQTKSTAISKALDDLEQRRFEANGKFNASREAEKKLISDLQIAEEKRSRGERLTQLQTNNLARKNTLLDKAAIAVQKERDEISKITADTDKWYKSLEPVIGAISKISSNADDLTKKLEAQRKAEENAAKSAKKLNDERKKQFELLGDIRSLRNQDFLDFDPTLKPIKKLDAKAYIESFSKSISDLPATNIDPLIDVLFPEKEFKALSDIWGKINKDTAPKLEEFKNQIRDALISKELSTGVKTTYDDVEKAISDAITRLQQLIASDASITQNFQDAINKGANEFEKLKEQAKGFDELKSTIESNLTRPFRDFFDDLLTNGKMSFDSFAELAKDALKRIAAQVIATGLAQLLATIINPAGAAASAALAAGKTGGGGILGILGGLFKSVNNPSFGGVQGGAMQMAGAVNLQLRGSDLVASINRTNTTINRVG
jgi:hypothetical protein